jgi:hypothetical protein
MLSILLIIFVLLNLVSHYTFIHIVLGTAVLWVLFRLVYGPPATEPLPEETYLPVPAPEGVDHSGLS